MRVHPEPAERTIPGHSLGHSATVEDYVKAIYAIKLQREGSVTTSALAERLDVTAPAASAMVKKLAEMGLASHERYRGVELTDEGTRVALEVMRHHRLLEAFLSKELGMPWDRVHVEADVLEHVISEELEQLIARKLGDPDHDPHGDPIPTADLRIDEGESVRLSDLEPGSTGIFARVSDSNPEMLRYLAERGIAPGDRLEVTERQPFGGPVFVLIAGDVHPLGGELADAMRVQVGR